MKLLKWKAPNCSLHSVCPQQRLLAMAAFGSYCLYVFYFDLVNYKPTHEIGTLAEIKLLSMLSTARGYFGKINSDVFCINCAMSMYIPTCDVTILGPSLVMLYNYCYTCCEQVEMNKLHDWS